LSDIVGLVVDVDVAAAVDVAVDGVGVGAVVASAVGTMVTASGLVAIVHSHSLAGMPMEVC
jgi:hypothetical protein